MILAWLHKGTRYEVIRALDVLPELNGVILTKPAHHYGLELEGFKIPVWRFVPDVPELVRVPKNGTAVFMDERNQDTAWHKKMDPLEARELTDQVFEKNRVLGKGWTLVTMPTHPVGSWLRQLTWSLRHHDEWADEARLTHFGHPAFNPNKTRRGEVYRYLEKYTKLSDTLNPAVLSPAPFNGGWWDRMMQPIKVPEWVQISRDSRVLAVAFWQLIEDGPHGLVTKDGQLTHSGRLLKGALA